MKQKKPKIKLSVGSLYYNINKPTTGKEYEPASFKADDTVNSPVIKSVGTSENAESTTVKSSGIDYDTVGQTASIELEVEVVAFDPTDLATLRAEHVETSGLVLSGRGGGRPYLAVGLPVIKNNGGLRLTWYPKCQLVSNTDDIATGEESFSEQNDTITIRAYVFNEQGDFKAYVDNEMENYPEGLTEDKYFAKPILNTEDLTGALSPTV